MKKILAGGFLSFCVLTAVNSATVSADEEMKETPIAVGTERAFPNLDFERPIVVTHAGDGTNRLFVAEQDGIIKVLKNCNHLAAFTFLGSSMAFIMASPIFSNAVPEGIICIPMIN